MGIYGASVDSMGAGHVAGDAGEVVTAGVDDDGGVVKIGGVAYCRRGEIPGFLQSHKRIMGRTVW